MPTLNTNLKFQRATTQFTNFPFSSMCNFNGKQLGAGPAGLCEMGGDLDCGVAIDAWFVPVISDWGSSKPKRVRFIYLGYQCNGELTISVTGNNGEAIPYKIPCHAVGAQQRHRVTVSRSTQKRYWDFKVANVNGADFSIDAIDCLFIELSHGHSEHT